MAQSAFSPAPKYPGAVLDHDMPWTDWLAEGDTIVDFSVTSNSDELVITDAAHAAGVISWRVSGGLARRVYLVTVEIESSDGTKDSCVLTYRMR